MPTITSRQNPIVARYRAAARGEQPDQILIDGPHLVAEALAAGVALAETAVTVAAAESAALVNVLSGLGRANVEVVTVSPAVMDALSPVRTSSGIVALAKRPVPDEAAIYSSASPLVVVAIDIQDPGNLGAIVRVAEAAGATGLIATGACADPFGWKALRGSMGSAFRLPIIAAESAAVAVATARARGCRIVATVPRLGQSLFDAELIGALAILVGSEGAGVSPALIDSADERVTIPMREPVESLNTSIAAALVLYEVRRQRTR
ncbi:MAG TPA: RNA methyltransferase [Vicinamibacterales bacterium]|jgi:TrmH family RNA methyltransferase